MNLAPQSKRVVVFICLLAVTALPSFAATHRRASSTPFEVTVTGTVTDAGNGTPVIGAEVTVANARAKVETDSKGKYSFIAKTGGLPVAIIASRSGYVAMTKTLNATTATATVDFALQPGALATIKDTNGAITTVDADSFKFAYLVPFSGYVSAEKANFCLADGSASHPDRTEISKITGPATGQTGTKCCNIGPVMSVQVTFKNGQTSTVYLTDSCFGNEVDVLARDHISGQFVYFNLTKVAEVNLP